MANDIPSHEEKRNPCFCFFFWIFFLSTYFFFFLPFFFLLLFILSFFTPRNPPFFSLVLFVFRFFFLIVSSSFLLSSFFLFSFLFSSPLPCLYFLEGSPRTWLFQKRIWIINSGTFRSGFRYATSAGPDRW